MPADKTIDIKVGVNVSGDAKTLADLGKGGGGGGGAGGGKAGGGGGGGIAAQAAKGFNSGGEAMLGQAAKGLGLSSLSGAAGGLAAAAGPIAAVVGGYAAVVAAASKAADAINIMGNASMNGKAKLNAMASEFVPGYDSLKKFVDAVDGTTERMRVQALAHEYNTKSIQVEADTRARTNDIGRQRSQLNAADRAAGGWNVAPGQKFDRSTVAGEQRTLDEDRRTEAADAIGRAQMNRNAAAQALDDQRRMTADAQSERRKAEVHSGGAAADVKTNFEGTEAQKAKANRSWDQLSRTERNLQRIGYAAAPLTTIGINQLGKNNVGASKEDSIKGLNKQQEADQDLLNKSKQVQTEITQQMERQKALIESESQLRKARIDGLKTELSILTDQERRMASAQQRLGMMNAGQYELAKQAALSLKEPGGFENATDEQKNLARQIDPAMVDKMAEGAGAARAKELAGLGVDSFKQDYADGNDLSKVRDKQFDVKTQVRMEVNLDAKQVAKESAEYLAPLLRELVREIKVQNEAELRGVKTGQALRQAQAGS